MFDSLFSQGGLSLERLKVLLEVKDAGSIVRAAPGDPVRQSQFSRQLRELSQFFGCEVVERRGKLLKLTSEGVRVAESARIFLRDLDDLQKESSKDRLTFSIAAGDSLIQWLVIPRAGKIAGMNPAAQFATHHLRTGEIVQQLNDARTDFGIIRKNAVVSGLRSVALGKLQYSIVVPANLLRRHQKISFEEALATLPLAAQTTDGEFSTRLREIATDAKIPFRPLLCCQSFPQVFSAVRSGEFAGVLPDIAVSEMPPGSFVRIDSLKLRALARDICLAWNPRTVNVRPAAPKILTTLQAALRF